MDNFTHTMAGWAIGQAGLKSKSRKGLAGLMLGASAPDIDVFFGWVPWEPLATHRGVTHSLVGGVIVLPVMLWGLLLLLDRWQVRRGTHFKSGLALNPKWLLALCYIGALTHPLLDLQTTYAVQLLSPFSGRWFHSDSLFIIDWVVWLVLIFGIARSQGREAAGEGNAGRPALIALVIVFAYICFNLGVTATAKGLLKARHPDATRIFASPPPGRFWDRALVWRTGDRIGRAQWTFAGGLSADKPLVKDGMADPAVRRAFATDPGLRDFLNWSVLPVALVTCSGATGKVLIVDARYGLPSEGQARLSHETIIDRCA